MKDIFISQGKKYISARRASDISDYSSDYVGQLCRAGKLDCTMVGRSWFVTEESLNNHRTEVLKKEIYRNRIANLNGSRKSTDSVKENKAQKSEVTLEIKQEIAQTSTVAPVVIPAKAGIQDGGQNDEENFALPVLNSPQSLSVSAESMTLDSRLRGNDNIEQKPIIKPIVWKFTYATDDRPLLPELDKSKISFEKKVIIEDKSKEKPRENKFKSVPSPIPTHAFVRPNAPIKTPTYPALARSVILRRVLSSVALVVIIFGFVGGGIFISGQNHNSVVAQNVSANVYDTVQSVITFFKNSYDQVLALFHKDKQVAVNNAPTIISEQQTPQGLAVVSSSGTAAGDEVIKNKIKDSFSDEVVVKPDQSGTAGVITPVFRNSKGTDFVYVLVPVKPDK